MGSIGRKIYYLRKSKYLSQEDLGFELGVARQTVSKWEKNSMRPTTDNIKALCEYFEVDPEYFLSDKIKAESKTKSETAVTSATDEPSKQKNSRNVLLIVLIILVSLLLVTSLIFGTIFTYIFYQSLTGDKQVITLDLNLGGIISFCIAIGALIMLIVLIIYFKTRKKK